MGCDGSKTPIFACCDSEVFTARCKRITATFPWRGWQHTRREFPQWDVRYLRFRLTVTNYVDQDLWDLFPGITATNPDCCVCHWTLDKFRETSILTFAVDSQTPSYTNRFDKAYGNFWLFIRDTWAFSDGISIEDQDWGDTFFSFRWRAINYAGQIQGTVRIDYEFPYTFAQWKTLLQNLYLGIDFDALDDPAGDIYLKDYYFVYSDQGVPEPSQIFDFEGTRIFTFGSPTIPQGVLDTSVTPVVPGYPLGPVTGAVIAGQYQASIMRSRLFFAGSWCKTTHRRGGTPVDPRSVALPPAHEPNGPMPGVWNAPSTGWPLSPAFVYPIGQVSCEDSDTLGISTGVVDLLPPPDGAGFYAGEQILTIPSWSSDIGYPCLGCAVGPP